MTDLDVNYITDDVKALIGMESDFCEMPHPVEASEVRRFHHAVMDDSPRYSDAGASRYGGPVAPLGFPVHMYRRRPGEPDPLDGMDSPDRDGLDRKLRPGLPPIDVPLTRLLNGGYRYTFYRYAEIGDRIFVKSRYRDIYQRSGRSGVMVLFDIEDTYVNQDRDLLLETKNTIILR
ncbi:hypothetical protein ATO13_08306 [Stappia sp. 22II-S9-Z10]|nr:hypothetical protein ATO13_08306 [Stappia sp. 22II-S9-Z10]